MHKVLLQSMIAICVLMGLSCKDLGDAVPPPPLIFNVSAVSVAVGNTAPVKISGGTRPYSVVSNSDAAKVIATVSNDTLQLRGLASGNATIVVGDNGSPRLTSSIVVTVLLLSVGQNSFNLTVEDSATTAISGGTPPYSVVSVSDPTKVSATISGSTLKVRALAAGNSTITIGDNGSPQLTTTANATIAARISFSSQVQPILDVRCVNPGCHPGGNAPFPLRSPQGYTQMVNQAATTGPCLPLQRVKPGDAANSALYRRLLGTCGDRMPLDGSGALPQAQIDLIRDWINQGARNN